MPGSCEVDVERAGTCAVVFQLWRYVARDETGAVVAGSAPFRGGTLSLLDGKAQRAALRDFLHQLGGDGWRPFGADLATTRGRRWYNVRLYREQRDAPAVVDVGQ